MKKFLVLVLGMVMSFQLSAQSCYWVFFTDKQNTYFDPYEYFDAKAIQRYQLNHQSLYDISNYPVNTDYKNEVKIFSQSYVGESRWLNAVAVTATDEQIDLISKLPFVSGVQLIETESEMAANDEAERVSEKGEYDGTMNQVAIMQGEKFIKAGINGKGVRIAVLDGGFSEADEHPAFKALRDNHQIIKTWNFVQNKENVYNGHYHGRMVLSCLAGIMNDSTMLGLASGAQYLLARTEVNVERKKEEVWWVAALEWADQNGADIISSSLGYGKERYNPKDMTGEKSMISKAANTAARKGILVVNAMGNEGDDEAWKVLIAPADADSILSVGAVTSLEKLASYSSFGPTADGRMKPNVVACGHDMVADKDGNYDYYDGTSFATPMVSGFAACVKQLHPDWTAMKLKEEIEKSGNHYPYYDYAFGYGVPQAGYFMDKDKVVANSFDLYEDKENIYVVPKKNTYPNNTLFYNVKNGNGTISDYDAAVLSADIDEEDSLNTDSVSVFSFSKEDLLNGQTVNFWYDGTFKQYVVGRDSLPHKFNLKKIASDLSDEGWLADRHPDNNFFKKSHKGTYGNYLTYLAMTTSMMIPIAWNDGASVKQMDRVSRSLAVVYGLQWNCTKIYNLGARIGFGSNWYAVANDNIINPFLSIKDQNYPDATFKKNNIKTTQFDLELYQRFNICQTGRFPIFFDTGVYGEWFTGNRYKMKIQDNDLVAQMVQRHFDKVNPFGWGVRARLGFSDNFAIYAQYRISKLLKGNYSDLPKFEVGIQIF